MFKSIIGFLSSLSDIYAKRPPIYPTLQPYVLLMSTVCKFKTGFPSYCMLLLPLLFDKFSFSNEPVIRNEKNTFRNFVLIVPSIYYLKILSISNDRIVLVTFSTMYKTDTKTKLWFSYFTPVKTQHKKQNPCLS